MIVYSSLAKGFFMRIKSSIFILALFIGFIPYHAHSQTTLAEMQKKLQELEARVAKLETQGGLKTQDFAGGTIANPYGGQTGAPGVNPTLDPETLKQLEKMKKMQLEQMEFFKQLEKESP